ncbi:MAG: stage II sporulation protein D [Bacillota bacterium]|nr:stage II sporulation protein D [Bacillota bacterium]MDW7684695.1 stage II sporulation protein D [Bacillota bacterium]
MAVLTGKRYTREAVESSGKIISRFDFTFDHKVTFNHFTFNDKPQVVIDFADVTSLPSDENIDDGLIAGVRYSRPKAAMMRVVFDMERMQPHSISVRENPFQVTICFSRTLLHVLHHDTIVQMEMEDYLAGVVSAEMPALFHKEALQAQAVAARSYTARRMKVLGGKGCRRHPEADICTSPGHCQAWMSRDQQQERWGKDYLIYKEKIDDAVRGTRWAVLLYQDRIADAVFHSTCGGKTEDASVIWGNKVAYLQSVPCKYDSHSPYFERKYTIEVSDLLKKTGANVSSEFYPAAPDGTPLLAKERVSPAHTVQAVRVGDNEFSGAQLRKLLELPSQWFDWSLASVELKTKGFGHRVGMCQYGADGYAKIGWDWQKILKHYYSGVEIARIEEYET